MYVWMDGWMYSFIYLFTVFIYYLLISLLPYLLPSLFTSFLTYLLLYFLTYLSILDHSERYLTWLNIKPLCSCPGRRTFSLPPPNTLSIEASVPSVTSWRADFQNCFFHLLSETWSKQNTLKEGLFSFMIYDLRSDYDTIRFKEAYCWIVFSLSHPGRYRRRGAVFSDGKERLSEHQPGVCEGQPVQDEAQRRPHLHRELHSHQRRQDRHHAHQHLR